MRVHPRGAENCRVQSSLRPKPLLPFPPLSLSVSVAALAGKSAGLRGNGADQGATQIVCVCVCAVHLTCLSVIFYFRWEHI